MDLPEILLTTWGTRAPIDDPRIIFFATLLVRTLEATIRQPEPTGEQPQEPQA
jgi:hypothetical protein